MLVVTTNALAPEEIEGVHWRGAIVLIVLPNSGLDSLRVRNLAASNVVIEYLEWPRSAAAILHDVASDVPRLMREIDGPLLYLDRPFSPDWLAEQVTQGATDPYEIVLETAIDGRTDFLRIGEMVATNPIVPELLILLKGSDSDTTFFARLQSALDWKAL